jgi:uncharacterized membrane protein (DUF4010 family)
MTIAAEPLLSDIGAVLLPLGYALAIGLLIGLERGWADREEADGTRVAGFRTFGLLGLLGGVAGLLPWPLAVVLVVATGLVLLQGYSRQSRTSTGRSATSAVAGLLVVGLGALAVRGQTPAAIASAAAVMFLLSMRQPLHGMLKGMNADELRASARFAILALVLLPLTPDRGMGPYAAWNPRHLLLVIVLVCGLSFSGYVLTRRLSGTRGLVVTAVCGAIVSSTAVTAAFARRLGENTASRDGLKTGIWLASAVSVARVLLLVALLTPAALVSTAMVALPALLILLSAAAFHFIHKDQRTDDCPQHLGNPLDIRGALALAAITAISIAASRWAIVRYGHLGSVFVLGVTGMVDVDAAVLAFAASPNSVAGSLAGAVLAMPVALNLIVKAGIVFALAPRRVGMRVAWPLALSAIAMLMSLAVLGAIR